LIGANFIILNCLELSTQLPTAWGYFAKLVEELGATIQRTDLKRPQSGKPYNCQIHCYWHQRYRPSV